MAAVVYKTIVFHKHLFCEAPTGTGKTISTLFPAVKAMGEHRINRIFYLTAKKSTRHVAESTVQLMADHGLKIKSIVISAKEQISFPEEANLDPAQNPDMVGYFDRLNPALRDLLKHENQITPQVITKYARKYTLDPFEFSLDASDFCDVIICDYNYLFDPEVKLKRFFAKPDPENCFLIDEAHNLVSRSRAMYSASLKSDQLNQIIKVTHHHRSRCRNLFSALKRLKTGFRSCQQRLNQSHQFSTSQTKPLRKFNHTIHSLVRTTQKWLTKQPQRDDLVNQIIQFGFACNSYLTIGGYYDSTYRTRMIHDRHHQITCQEFCLDPSKYLARSLKLGGSAIMFSATLSPMSYYQRTLGNEKDSLAYQLPSPFPPECQKIIITNYIQTTYRQRKQNQNKIVHTIHALVTSQTGHYLIFFPSYRYLDTIFDEFKQRYPQLRTLKQTNSMNNQQQSNFLNQFKQNYQKSLVGFAILGSNFSEGIDLKGKALIGVGIVGVGLPKINDQTNLVKDYFDAEGHGFEYAYQIPGLNKVLQAAGRLIRSANDCGVIALMDQRFNEFRYRRFLPDFWQVKTVSNLKQFKTIIKKFWK